jgi:hypothetical protein
MPRGGENRVWTAPQAGHGACETRQLPSRPTRATPQRAGRRQRWHAGTDPKPLSSEPRVPPGGAVVFDRDAERCGGLGGGRHAMTSEVRRGLQWLMGETGRLTKALVNEKITAAVAPLERRISELSARLAQVEGAKYLRRVASRCAVSGGRVRDAQNGLWFARADLHGSRPGTSKDWHSPRVAAPETTDAMCDDDARDGFVGELRQAIAETLDAALDERHRAHAVALFAAGRDAEIPDSLVRLRAHGALLRPGLLISVERAVLARLGLRWTHRGGVSKWRSAVPGRKR